MGSIEEQVNDLINSLRWILKCIGQSKYNGNKKEIILSGHSAGAHLSLLTALTYNNNLNSDGKKILKKILNLKNLYYLMVHMILNFLNINFLIFLCLKIVIKKFLHGYRLPKYHQLKY